MGGEDRPTAGTATASSRGWEARPAAAGAIRMATAALPILAAVAAGVVFTTQWPRPAAVGAQVSWWAASVGAAVVASFVMARLARRALPLATLLTLTLSFPDRTPSRFAVALRAGGTSDLKERAQRLVNADLTVSEAASEALVLATALTHHDRATRGHSERVRAMTEVLAEELGLSSEDRDRLRWAGLLHDVGKVTVPSSILNKPGPRNDDERTVMKSHPVASGRMVEPLRPWLGDWTDAVAQHHERFDGTGYPDGLQRNEISLGARIVAVADTFEVMTSARSYKRPLPATVARQEISGHAGDLFDPAVARALLNVSLGRLRWRTGPLVWIAAFPLVAKLRARAGWAGVSGPSVVAGAASGVLAAALSVGPAASPVVPAAAAARPSTGVLQPAVRLLPQEAAAVAPPAAAASPAVLHVRETQGTAAGVSTSPALPAPIQRPTGTATRANSAPFAASRVATLADAPLVEVTVDLAPVPVRATATVGVPVPARLPMHVVVPIGPLP
ncbi:MAG: HD-GYP domain-containing protein [Acidimicrobiia bacterium]|nr:HD-GYP domain-containing protein [Acidimicrobiia bacterium]